MDIIQSFYDNLASQYDKLFLDFKTAKLGNGQKHRHGKEYASEICDIIGKYRKF